MTADRTHDSLWRIRVDTGGTFTDAWAIGPDGLERRCKILSDGSLRCRVLAVAGDTVTTDSTTDAADSILIGWLTAEGWPVLGNRDGARTLTIGSPGIMPGQILELSCDQEAPVVAARLLTGTGPAQDLPPMDFRVATTRGTNALLERKGARLAYFTTLGFADQLLLRDQRRERLFSLDQPQPSALPAFTAEVAGRLDAQGNELSSLDREGLAAAAHQSLSEGCESAAIAFLHSWTNPAHEQEAGQILRAAGFRHVTLSSEVAPLIRLLPRAETAVADAFLAPVMERFTRRISAPLGGRVPWMMTSAGGLVPADRFRPKDSLLSGPAGGLVGAAEMARAAGYPRVLAFDMGGTSTDVSRIDGPFTWRYEQEIGPARVFAPALKIDTVAAGGGSICQWRGGRLEVGPESAGANPGPACYGRGGPLTMTDVNLLLGLMDPGKAGIPLDRSAAHARLLELIDTMRAAGQMVEEEALLLGLREIGVEIMAEAIRAVSVREGRSAQDHALLAFGGAGPQHACAVADRLGISSVLVPADAGLLSAWGLEKARRQEQRVKQVLLPFPELGGSLENVAGASCPSPFERRPACRSLVPHASRFQSGGAFSRQSQRAGIADLWQSLAAEATTALAVDQPDLRWLADIRLTGQDSTIPVEAPSASISLEDLGQAFTTEYRKLYGYPPPAGRVMELVTLRVVAEETAASQPQEEFSSFTEDGPLLLQDRFSTCVIAAGWTCRRGSRGTLLLEKAQPAALAANAMPAAVRAGLFRSRIEGVVAAMGEMLRRTALSTNVKERLDYSCALLDARGYLVASAPHVPVHLGALGVCVRETLRVITPGSGDVIVTNHPAFGGSHLPDVTVIAPVHTPSGELLGYVANRAHHAEIGGMAPGSMPAGARCLAEEGVVIPPCLLVRSGVPAWEEVTALLTGGPWPTRRLSDNLADLEAQLAACSHGAAALSAMAAEDGAAQIYADLSAILANSTARMAERLRGLSLERTVRSTFDDGTPLQLRVFAAHDRLNLDFTGTGPVHPRNLNATPAIVRSTVLFALRLWLGEDLPLNEGLLEAVDIVIPECLLNPHFPADPAAAPAVVGGNVETSQRLCDLLLEALDLAANGPGTMNNFLFGDETFGYYETIAGGSGGGPHHTGSSGRHVHMTNTAITDAEIMEHRYPVRLLNYAIRRNSCGAGAHPGGNGVTRTIEFLRPLTVSFLTQRRLAAPKGLHCGSNGAPGSQTRIHPDASEEILPPSITYQAAAGELVRIHTPGGGGWGSI